MTNKWQKADSFTRNSRPKSSKRNVSKFAQKVIDFLEEHHVFPGNMLVEVPLNTINSKGSKSQAVDIYYPGLLAIEVNGEQHYEPVRFGGISDKEAELRLERQKTLDLKKRLMLSAVDIPLLTIREKELKEMSYDFWQKKLEEARDILENPLKYYGKK